MVESGLHAQYQCTAAKLLHKQWLLVDSRAVLLSVLQILTVTLVLSLPPVDILSTLLCHKLFHVCVLYVSNTQTVY